MKRMEVTEKVIGENTFYINPFPAFTAASISGELTTLLAPALVGIAPLIGNLQTSGNAEADEETDVMNVDVDSLLTVFASAVSGLSGERIERMMTRLLVENGNISIEGEATGGEVKRLTKDLADEVFCMNLQDMFALCYEVIKVNFGGMIAKLADKVKKDHTSVEQEA